LIAQCSRSRPASRGDRRALLSAADLLRAAGRVDEANGFFQRAVEAGEPEALMRMAQPPERAHRLDEAVHWYQRATKAGPATPSERRPT